VMPGITASRHLAFRLAGGRRWGLAAMPSAGRRRNLRDRKRGGRPAAQ
jgi:hypothetical protein